MQPTVIAKRHPKISQEECVQDYWTETEVCVVARGFRDTLLDGKVHQLIELDYEQIEPERSESKQAKENITMIF